MKGKLVVFIIIGIILVLGIWSVVTYNSLVTAVKNVDRAKAQVGVVCQRRLDLIPNLVETVKGYAEHEKETLVAVTNARTKAQRDLTKMISESSPSSEDVTSFSTSQSELVDALNRLYVLVEGYPDLKASSNFRSLQDQLEGTENRIAVERMRYNNAVTDYNTKISVFPNTIIAGICGFHNRELFQETEEAQQPVKVTF
jgi:LemA protein